MATFNDLSLRYKVAVPPALNPAEAQEYRLAKLDVVCIEECRALHHRSLDEARLLYIQLSGRTLGSNRSFSDVLSRQRRTVRDLERIAASRPPVASQEEADFWEGTVYAPEGEVYENGELRR